MLPYGRLPHYFYHDQLRIEQNTGRKRRGRKPQFAKLFPLLYPIDPSPPSLSTDPLLQFLFTESSWNRFDPHLIKRILVNEPFPKPPTPHRTAEQKEQKTKKTDDKLFKWLTTKCLITTDNRANLVLKLKHNGDKGTEVYAKERNIFNLIIWQFQSEKYPMYVSDHLLVIRRQVNALMIELKKLPVDTYPDPLVIQGEILRRQLVTLPEQWRICEAMLSKRFMKEESKRTTAEEKQKVSDENQLTELIYSFFVHGELVRGLYILNEASGDELLRQDPLAFFQKMYNDNTCHWFDNFAGDSGAKVTIEAWIDYAFRYCERKKKERDPAAAETKKDLEYKDYVWRHHGISGFYESDRANSFIRWLTLRNYSLPILKEEVKQNIDDVSATLHKYEKTLYYTREDDFTLYGNSTIDVIADAFEKAHNLAKKVLARSVLDKSQEFEAANERLIWIVGKGAKNKEFQYYLRKCSRSLKYFATFLHSILGNSNTYNDCMTAAMRFLYTIDHTRIEQYWYWLHSTAIWARLPFNWHSWIRKTTRRIHPVKPMGEWELFYKRSWLWLWLNFASKRFDIAERMQTEENLKGRISPGFMTVKRDILNQRLTLPKDDNNHPLNLLYQQAGSLSTLQTLYDYPERFCYQWRDEDRVNALIHTFTKTIESKKGTRTSAKAKRRREDDDDDKKEQGEEEEEEEEEEDSDDEEDDKLPISHLVKRVKIAPKKKEEEEGDEKKEEEEGDEKEEDEEEEEEEETTEEKKQRIADEEEDHRQWIEEQIEPADNLRFELYKVWYWAYNRGDAIRKAQGTLTDDAPMKLLDHKDGDKWTRLIVDKWFPMQYILKRLEWLEETATQEEFGKKKKKTKTKKKTTTAATNQTSDPLDELIDWCAYAYETTCLYMSWCIENKHPLKEREEHRGKRRKQQILKQLKEEQTYDIISLESLQLEDNELLFVAGPRWIQAYFADWWTKRAELSTQFDDPSSHATREYYLRFCTYLFAAEQFYLTIPYTDWRLVTDEEADELKLEPSAARQQIIDIIDQGLQQTQEQMKLLLRRYKMRRIDTSSKISITEDTSVPEPAYHTPQKIQTTIESPVWQKVFLRTKKVFRRITPRRNSNPPNSLYKEYTKLFDTDATKEQWMKFINTQQLNRLTPATGPGWSHFLRGYPGGIGSGRDSTFFRGEFQECFDAIDTYLAEPHLWSEYTDLQEILLALRDNATTDEAMSWLWPPFRAGLYDVLSLEEEEEEEGGGEEEEKVAIGRRQKKKYIHYIHYAKEEREVDNRHNIKEIKVDDDDDNVENNDDDDLKDIRELVSTVKPIKREETKTKESEKERREFLTTEEDGKEEEEEKEEEEGDEKIQLAEIRESIVEMRERWLLQIHDTIPLQSLQLKDNELLFVAGPRWIQAYFADWWTKRAELSDEFDDPSSHAAREYYLRFCTYLFTAEQFYLAIPYTDWRLVTDEEADELKLEPSAARQQIIDIIDQGLQQTQVQMKLLLRRYKIRRINASSKISVTEDTSVPEPTYHTPQKIQTTIESPVWRKVFLRTQKIRSTPRRDSNPPPPNSLYEEYTELFDADATKEQWMEFVNTQRLKRFTPGWSHFLRDSRLFRGEFQKCFDAIDAYLAKPHLWGEYRDLQESLLALRDNATTDEAMSWLWPQFQADLYDILSSEEEKEGAEKKEEQATTEEEEEEVVVIRRRQKKKYIHLEENNDDDDLKENHELGSIVKPSKGKETKAKETKKEEEEEEEEEGDEKIQLAEIRELIVEMRERWLLAVATAEEVPREKPQSQPEPGHYTASVATIGRASHNRHYVHSQYADCCEAIQGHEAYLRLVKVIPLLHGSLSGETPPPDSLLANCELLLHELRQCEKSMFVLLLNDDCSSATWCSLIAHWNYMFHDFLLKRLDPLVQKALSSSSSSLKKGGGTVPMNCLLLYDRMQPETRKAFDLAVVGEVYRSQFVGKPNEPRRRYSHALLQTKIAQLIAEVVEVETLKKHKVVSHPIAHHESIGEIQSKLQALDRHMESSHDYEDEDEEDDLTVPIGYYEMFRLLSDSWTHLAPTTTTETNGKLRRWRRKDNTHTAGGMQSRTQYDLEEEEPTIMRPPPPPPPRRRRHRRPMRPAQPEEDPNVIELTRDVYGGEEENPDIARILRKNLLPWDADDPELLAITRNLQGGLRFSSSPRTNKEPKEIEIRMQFNSQLRRLATSVTVIWDKYRQENEDVWNHPKTKTIYNLNKLKQDLLERTQSCWCQLMAYIGTLPSLDDIEKMMKNFATLLGIPPSISEKTNRKRRFIQWIVRALFETITIVKAVTGADIKIQKPQNGQEQMHLQHWQAVESCWDCFKIRRRFLMQL